MADIKICVLDINDIHNLDRFNETTNLLDDNTIILYNKCDTYTNNSQQQKDISDASANNSQQINYQQDDKLKHFKQMNISCLTNEGVPEFMQQLEQQVANLYVSLPAPPPSPCTCLLSHLFFIYTNSLFEVFEQVPPTSHC